MLKIIFTLLASILSLLVNAQDSLTNDKNYQNGIEISVKIPKISNNKGKVYFALYNSKENFDNKEAYQVAVGTIANKKTAVTFKNIPQGTYAITCYHDKNDNKQLDFIGFIPTEDYGSSNNPFNFGPPRFKSSKFNVATENITITIKF
jgi:uncharacterized protein (DUF2141 family)